MNIKDTINFKMLRDKGFNSLEVKEDEIIQVMTKTGMKCVVTQDFLFELLAKSEKLDTILNKPIKRTPYNENDLFKNFNEKFGSLNLMGAATNISSNETKKFSSPNQGLLNSNQLEPISLKDELEKVKKEFNLKIKLLEDKINQGGKNE